MTAQLWVPGPLPGLNELIGAAKGSGGLGMAYAKLKREWTTTIWALTKQKRMKKFNGPVSMTFSWAEKDRRRDPDNVAAGGRKLILDGLVKAGVLEGDGWKHIALWTDSFSVRPDAPGVFVTIEDAAEGIPF